jgi:hypothetical protein
MFNSMRQIQCSRDARSETTDAGTTARDSRLIGEKSLIVGDRVYGAQQAGDAFTFRNVAPRSRRLGHVHHAGALVHGQQKDSDTRKPFVNLSRGGEAVKNRHRDVENYQIWTQLRDLFQGFQPIGGFSAHFKAARLQNGSHTGTQRLVVVYNQDSQSTLSFPSLRGEAARVRASRLYGGFPRDNPVDTLQGIHHATCRGRKISLLSRLLSAFLLARPPHSLRCTT